MTFQVRYLCAKLDLMVTRTIWETDPINAILAARREERRLLTACCADCTLLDVTAVRA